MFNYQRKAVTSYSVPSWLSEPGKVLLKWFVKNLKYEPDMAEVELLEANPQYAYIKYPNGRESTVSLRHLAPIGRKDNFNSQTFNNTFERQLETPIIEDQPVNQIITSNEQIDIENDRTVDKEVTQSPNLDVEQNIPLRRSTRIRKPPVKLDLWT